MMSTKDLHNNKNNSLLDLVQQASGLKPAAIYKALGWSRQRYYESRKEDRLGVEYLKLLRYASGLSTLEFYAVLEKYLSK